MVLGWDDEDVAEMLNAKSSRSVIRPHYCGLPIASRNPEKSPIADSMRDCHGVWNGSDGCYVIRYKSHVRFVVKATAMHGHSYAWSFERREG